ncbi:CoxG family protein [Thermogemmatispora sp.]|uniref:Carbon monoxide dehydrogenase n=1 Tax=Thermogemmatispora argillosa TaxID=2045280 RepID=A0A455SZV7_9CHLR|nr:carbon monoxide dehydrogenase subunit G [Thermogemmatispora sp.]MBX5450723.1 carbon monoxide dehydrogenase subunit G [Thermogemmatispora sp.]BBH92442.1 carbon monoxide dehydrogenase [Thermogemmatispora argillosa]
MKFNGTYKFHAPSQRVFEAILNPDVLKQCIPGCEAVEYADANHLKVTLSVPLPGLKGPYTALLNIVQRQAPNLLVLQLQRQGRGGSIDATAQITLNDEPDGALLSYEANAEMSGPIAVVNNPVGQGVAKNSLSTFFKNLEKVLAA